MHLVRFIVKTRGLEIYSKPNPSAGLSAHLPYDECVGIKTRTRRHIDMKQLTFLLLASVAISVMGCGGAPESSSDLRSDASADASAWLTEFDQARALATEKNRPILMNFTGSDWCPPCKQLKNDILSTKQFAKFADEELVLLELDFPQRTPQPDKLKQQNEELSETFKIEGFPTLVLLDSQGNELARNVGYMPGGPKRFVEWAEAAQQK